MGLRRFLRERRGGSSAEFVLVLIPLTMLTIGALNLCVMLYSAASLHFATQDTARCAAVKSDVCSDATAINTYGRSRFKGVGSNVTFTDSGNCVVTGSATYKFITGFSTTSVPLTASACYPKVTPS